MVKPKTAVCLFLLAFVLSIQAIGLTGAGTISFQWVEADNSDEVGFKTFNNLGLTGLSGNGATNVFVCFNTENTNFTYYNDQKYEAFSIEIGCTDENSCDNTNSPPFSVDQAVFTGYATVASSDSTITFYGEELPTVKSWSQLEFSYSYLEGYATFK
jgi:hypothetical protein